MGKTVRTAMQYERTSALSPRSPRASGAKFRRESAYLSKLSSWRLVQELLSRHQLLIVETLLTVTWTWILVVRLG